MPVTTVNQEFHFAPLGNRSIYPVVFTAVCYVAGAAASIYISFTRMPAHTPPAPRVLALLAPLVGLFIAVPVFFIRRARVARFRIEENCLVLGRKRFPLEGLVQVVRDPEILRWSIRTGGNGGLGAIRGRFWSKRVGRFYAFMTDREKAVVLRWPGQTVAVSPVDPEFFIYTVRSATGLK